MAALRRRRHRRLGVRAPAARRRHRPGGRARVAGRAHPRPRRRVCGVRSRSAPRPSLAAVLALLLAGCGGRSDGAGGAGRRASRMHDDDGMHGVVLPEPYAVPDVPLDRHRRAAVRPGHATPTKPLTLVFFGYTHCPDICQVVMADIASALTRLDDAQRDQVGMLFVTTDPARDDAADAARLPRPVRPVVRRAHRRPARRSSSSARPFGVAIEKGQKLAVRRLRGRRTAPRSSACCPDGTGRRSSGPRAPTRPTLADDITHDPRRQACPAL